MPRLRATTTFGLFGLACTGTVRGGTDERGLEQGCAGCPDDAPVCLDEESCVAECPDAREACSLADGAACCPEGETCCAAAATGYADGDHCSRGGVCPRACPNGGACADGEWCRFDPALGRDACVDACEGPNYATCGGRTCCPLGSRCMDGACPLPDLVFDQPSIAGESFVAPQSFGASACEIEEGCVLGTGERLLLHFPVTTVNLGPGDLALGDPEGNPLFEYSSCHGHWHFTSFARYALVDADGEEVVPGRKMSFCIIDMYAYTPDAGPSRGGNCNYLTAGWADVYGVGLACQWIDVTDVAPGSYTLRVEANPDRLLVEADTSNNVVEAAVRIP